MMKIISEIAELAHEINNNSMMRIVLFVDGDETRITVSDLHGRIKEISLNRNDPCFIEETEELLLNLKSIYNEENILQYFMNSSETTHSTYSA